MPESGLDALLNRRAPSSFERFWTSPVAFAAKALYSRFEPVVHVPKYGISVVCISDTHNSQPKLPNGDLLLHAGDLTQSGSLGELQKQIDWLDSQPHKFKVVIAGNHDLYLALKRSDALESNATPLNWRSLIYLQDSSTTLQFHNGRSLKIYGSPWTPKHGNWAFQYPRDGTNVWKDIVPEGTDILLTHGPPQHHLDLDKFGCTYLLEEIRSKPPLLHVFGHIHAGYGKRAVIWDKFERAYEQAIRSGSWWELCKMVIYLLRGRQDGGKTVLVNAAAVGGFRDNKQRKAVTITI